MAIVKCPNGHAYDDAIYGDNCPYCPTKVSYANMNNAFKEESTRVIGGGTDPMRSTPQQGSMNSEEKATQVLPNYGGVNDAQEYEKEHTHIHHINNPQIAQKPVNNPNETVAIPENGRRIVGLIVSYDNNPNGTVSYIYEGRTIVGKDSSCDIVIKGDAGVSGRHLIILYREVEDKFWLIDDNSSNGTYLNGEFAGDKVQIHTNDVITIGSTKLVFWAIPKIWD